MAIKVIENLRQTFCKHDFELMFENDVTVCWAMCPVNKYREKIYRCKKCGAEKRYTSE